MKKEGLFLLICAISISFFAAGVSAQIDISTIDENAELQETEGSVNNEEPVEETITDTTTDPTAETSGITGNAFLDYYYG